MGYKRLKIIVYNNFYMKYKSINFITNYLIDITHKECDTIIKQICDDKCIDPEIIKKKYDNSVQICHNIKKTLDTEIRCLGIIKSGSQCARTRKNNSDFCLIHQKSLKFGKKHNFQPKVDSPE